MMADEKEVKLTQHKVQNAIKVGYLKKRGGKWQTWKNRYFILYGRELFYLSSPKDLQPKGVLLLDDDIIHTIQSSETLPDSLSRSIDASQSEQLSSNNNNDASSSSSSSSPIFGGSRYTFSFRVHCSYSAGERWRDRTYHFVARSRTELISWIQEICAQTTPPDHEKEQKSDNDDGHDSNVIDDSVALHDDDDDDDDDDNVEQRRFIVAGVFHEQLTVQIVECALALGDNAFVVVLVGAGDRDRAQSLLGERQRCGVVDRLDDGDVERIERAVLIVDDVERAATLAARFGDDVALTLVASSSVRRDDALFAERSHPAVRWLSQLDADVSVRAFVSDDAGERRAALPAVRTVFVYGGQGAVSGALVQRLLERHADIELRVAVNSERVERRLRTLLGDRGKVALVAQASPELDALVDSADAAFVCLALASDGAMQAQLDAVLRALERSSSLRRVVLQSALAAADRCGDTPIGALFRDAEAAVRDAALPAHCVLRVNSLHQNIANLFVHAIRGSSAFAAPVQGGRVAYIDARDVAAVAESALLSSKHDSATLELSGAEALSYVDVARILSSVLDVDVFFESVEPTHYADTLLRYGMPDVIVAALLSLFELQAGNVLASPLGDSPRISFRDYAQEHQALFRK
jgi:uncharacterized protein YbjT (DUF2867 family)